jgi:nitroimidazol reductase NimA-like FMN-containing flavoprotein (pyridoxamine 5'-phosphate oxidase superfamily)
MGVRLSNEEAWEFLAAAHVGVMTSLTKLGWPIALPTWFVVRDETIWFRTPVKAKKVQRIRNDDRGSFLVEDGTAWAELRAVMVRVRFNIINDESQAEVVSNMIAEKYAAFRPRQDALPGATLKTYADQLYICARPVSPLTSWDNSRIRMRSGS